ncbi:MAG: hypothetical protein II897_03490 [Clostridia bacterium]|nr:hypothetical protein [Clostridia bacterium]
MVKNCAVNILTFIAALAAVILLFIPPVQFPLLSLVVLFPMLNIVIAVSEYGTEPLRAVLLGVLTVMLGFALFLTAKRWEGLYFVQLTLVLYPALGIAAELFCIFKPESMYRGSLWFADEFWKCWIEIGVSFGSLLLAGWFFALFAPLSVLGLMLPVVRNIFLAKKLRSDAGVAISLGKEA